MFMAKRTSSKKTSMKSKKTYPVVRQAPLSIDGSPDTNAVIRVDRALSGINHRLYRQSRTYTCKVDLDVNAPAGQVVEVYALANSWMCKKAYQLAHKQFLENSAEEREQLGKMNARWNDFRVDHGLGVTFQKDLLMAGFTPGVVGLHKYGTSNSEYTMSEVSDASGTSFTMRWSGSGGNTYNIIDEYDVTGNTDQSPTTRTTSVAYDGLSDEVDDSQMEHLSDDGNAPPYDRTAILNQVWIRVGTLSVNATGQQRLSTGFFDAPCGLIVLTSSAPLANDSAVLNLEVKGGDYKGVHATSMLE